jgi:hypothetical protein
MGFDIRGGKRCPGRLMLWKRAVQVEPVSAFDRNGRWVKSGHYVIDHNGDAIVVHCGNVRDESVSVQFMHEETDALRPAPWHDRIDALRQGSRLR